MVLVLEISIFQSGGNVYILISGVAMATALFLYLIVHNRFFIVRIGEHGFYCRTNPFNGAQYKYEEITDCREIKRVVRHRRHFWQAATPRYFFFFEFTDVHGEVRKFQFAKPIHEHEVNVLKERIEKAIQLQKQRL